MNLTEENNKFTSLTVFVLAVDEKESLKQTVETITKTCEKKDIEEIVIVLKSDLCPSCIYADSFIDSFPDFSVVKYVQKGSNLIESLSELPPLAKGSHFVIMSSDLEMNPEVVSTFISKAKENPCAIISASKWNKKSSVTNYGLMRKIFSTLVNRFVGILYGVSGSDFFSLFEIYPVSVYNQMNFSKDSFLYEYTLKPLKMKIEYYEFPTSFNRRKEGKTHFDFKINAMVTIKYLKTAIRLKYNYDK